MNAIVAYNLVFCDEIEVSRTGPSGWGPMMMGNSSGINKSTSNLKCVTVGV